MRNIKKYSLLALLASSFSITSHASGPNKSLPSTEELRRMFWGYQAKPITQPQSQRPRVVSAMALDPQVEQEFAEWIKAQLHVPNLHQEAVLPENLLIAVNPFLNIPGTVGDGLGLARKARAVAVRDIVVAYRGRQQPIQDQHLLNLRNFLQQQVMPVLFSQGFLSGSIADMDALFTRGLERVTESEIIWLLENFQTISSNITKLAVAMKNWTDCMQYARGGCDAAVGITAQMIQVLLDEEIQRFNHQVAQLGQFIGDQLAFQEQIKSKFRALAEARENAARALSNFQKVRSVDNGQTYQAGVTDEIDRALQRKLQEIMRKEAQLKDLLDQRPILKVLAEREDLDHAFRMALRPIK